MTNNGTAQLEKEVSQLLTKIPQLKSAIQTVIVGQDEVINQMIACLLAGGHGLLEGVPGLAKTLMIQTFSKAVDLSFKRIQFTPDLMPSDVLGTEILQEDDEGQRHFKFAPGPVFTNILLADEINRTPPKTQSALLELMQEGGFTYAGKRYEIAKPFYILATQNPIEQAGTFPLPEAQVDRFLIKINVNYPSAAEEDLILEQTTGVRTNHVESVIDGSEIIKLQKLCREVHIEKSLIHKVSKMIRSTRLGEDAAPIIKEYIEWGAGPRAGQAVILIAKAFALINGRYAVIPSDLESALYPTLRHRLLLNFKAQSEGLSSDAVITELVKFHNWN